MRPEVAMGSKRLTDDALALLAPDSPLAREVLKLRRQLEEVEQRARNGRVQRRCLLALKQPGTVADVAKRLNWSYARARTWVHKLHRLHRIVKVDTVRSASGQMAGRYVVAS